MHSEELGGMQEMWILQCWSRWRISIIAVIIIICQDINANVCYHFRANSFFPVSLLGILSLLLIHQIRFYPTNKKNNERVHRTRRLWRCWYPAMCWKLNSSIVCMFTLNFPAFSELMGQHPFPFFCEISFDYCYLFLYASFPRISATLFCLEITLFCMIVSSQLNWFFCRLISMSVL